MNARGKLFHDDFIIRQFHLLCVCINYRLPTRIGRRSFCEFVGKGFERIDSIRKTSKVEIIKVCSGSGKDAAEIGKY